MNIRRSNYSSGAPLEEKYGYSRVVKVGPFIYVGGTTSVQPDGTVYGETSYEQMKYVLEKQVKLVEEAGGSVGDIISVKSYVTLAYDAKEAGKAYSDIFKGTKPLNTMVTIESLNRPTQLCEVEMMAVVGCSTGATWEGINLQRENFSSGSPLEDVVGYSRMVKVGPFVYVGGTTSVLPDGTVAGEGNSDAQDDFILKKELDLLAKVGAKPEDVVKTKMYSTSEYKNCHKGGENVWGKYLKPVKPLCTGVTIAKLTRPTQLVETEMMAIIGCGGDEILPEWGNIDFRRQNIASGAPAEESFGYSRIVKVGPFVYFGGTTTVQPDGTVLYEEDSKAQESYIYEKLMKLGEPLGVTDADVVKVKSYHTAAFKDYVKPAEGGYYAEHFKAVKPLNTVVTVSALSRPTQLLETEMMAVIGCGE